MLLFTYTHMHSCTGSDEVGDCKCNKDYFFDTSAKEAKCSFQTGIYDDPCTLCPPNSETSGIQTHVHESASTCTYALLASAVNMYVGFKFMNRPGLVTLFYLK
jgi:hypothetical protein